MDWEALADRWWNPARSREWVAAFRTGAPINMEYLTSRRWVPERPEPRLPSKWVIASYWAQRDDWFDIDLDRPHCFACGTAGGYLEDEPERSGGGLA